MFTYNYVQLFILMELEMNIQIMKIYKESFHNVRSHKIEWMEVAFAPILIWILGALFLAYSYYISTGNAFEINTAFFQGLTPSIPGEDSTLLSIAHVVYTITYFIAMTSLAINGYRYAILQEGKKGWTNLNLNMRFVKMILYYILVSILAGIYVAISAGIIFGTHSLFENMGVNIILGILLSFYGLYLLLRITLYPVLISVDQSAPLSTSWNLLRGNIIRLIGLFLMVGLTVLLIGAVGAIILGLLTTLFSVVGPILTVVSLVLWFLFAVFMVLLGWAVNAKALGLVYQELSATSKATLKAS